MEIDDLDRWLAVASDGLLALRRALVWADNSDLMVLSGWYFRYNTPQQMVSVISDLSAPWPDLQQILLAELNSEGFRRQWPTTQGAVMVRAAPGLVAQAASMYPELKVLGQPPTPADLARAQSMSLPTNLFDGGG